MRAGAGGTGTKRFWRSGRQEVGASVRTGVLWLSACLPLCLPASLLETRARTHPKIDEPTLASELSSKVRLCIL